jgi:predicted negative regulator of RcsB-dependent stress response
MKAAEDTVLWSAEHRTRLIMAAVIAVVVVGAVFGGWYFLNQQDQQASFELSQAVRTMDTPLRPANMPPEPDNPTFASSKERATEASKQLRNVVDKYPHTRSAEFARYYLGVTAINMGDDAAATRQFQTVADSHNANLSALAKMALASLYRSQHQNKQAIELYKGLIAKPAETVGKATAQVGLAEAYEADGQTAEAKQIYQQIQKDNPTSAASQLAQEKLQSLK